MSDFVAVDAAGLQSAGGAHAEVAKRFGHIALMMGQALELYQSGTGNDSTGQQLQALVPQVQDLVDQVLNCQAGMAGAGDGVQSMAQTYAAAESEAQDISAGMPGAGQG